MNAPAQGLAPAAEPQVRVDEVIPEQAFKDILQLLNEGMVSDDPAVPPKLTAATACGLYMEDSQGARRGACTRDQAVSFLTRFTGEVFGEATDNLILQIRRCPEDGTIPLAICFFLKPQFCFGELRPA